MNSKLLLIPVCGAMWFLSLSGSTLAQQRIEVPKETDPKRLIPIALQGFTGEVQSVLKFDLEVMGFELVAPDKAQFLVEGKNSGSIEARLTDRVTKAQLLGTRYEGGSLRAQAHALSDDIVLKVTGQPGIARTKIAFRNQTGSKMDIYVADYDGANAIRVSNDNAVVAAPAWVPGQWILYYTSYRSTYPDIYSHNLKTGERRVFANYPGLNTSAAISPDGRRVAMILSKNGSPDLFVANADGSGLKRLTTTRETEASPCWSPDGKTICVVSAKDGLPGLFLISPEGGSMRRLRTLGAGTVTEPDWSPDGQSIAFTAQWRQFQICVVPSSGGSVEVLAEGEDPSWAPNSRTIIFTRVKNGRQVLSLLDVPTKRVKDVAHSSGSWSQPSWAK